MLYLQAKAHIKKEVRDKTTEELEYERFKSECTFSPKVGGNLTQSLVSSPRDIEKFNEDKFIKKDIERL